MKTANPIDVVEAAYELELDDRGWLTNLAHLVRPLIDGGRGVIVYLADQTTPPTSWLDDSILIGAPGEDLELARTLTASMPEIIRLGHDLQRDSLATMSELPAMFNDDASPPLAAYLRRLRARGACGNARFGTTEPSGASVNFVAAQLRPRRFDARTKRLWERVAAHIAAGRRLRARLGEPDAVLTPSGRVEHAVGEARDALQALRQAVVHQDKARGRMRRDDPAGATEAWTALVAGRWSLVDHFERGGRRYVVARRNEHALSDPRALTPRERAIVHLAALGNSNKLIAYELGLSDSTVGTHLSAAMRKLQVASRVELVHVLAQWG